MSLARKGAAVFLAHGLAVAVTFANHVILARRLDPGGVGVYSILTSAVVLLTAVGGLGLPAVAIYLVQRGESTDRSLLVQASILAAVVTLLAVAATVLFREAFLVAFFQAREVDGRILGLALAALPFSLVLTFAGSLLLGRGLAGAYSGLTAAMVLGELAGFLLLVVWLDGGIAGALVTFTGSRVLFAAATAGVVIRRTRGQACPVRMADLVRLLRFGIPQYPGSLGPHAFMRVDNLLLGYFAGEKTVGLFSIPVAFYLVLQMMPRAVSGLLTGRVSSSGGKKEAALLVCRVSRLLLWGLAAGAVVLGMAGPWLVPFFFGPSFLASVPALPALLAAGVLAAYTAEVQAYFVGTGRPGVNGLLTLAAGGANVVLNLLFIPSWGMMGSAWATLAAGGLAAALHLAVFRSMTEVPLRALLVPTREDWGRLRDRLLGRPATGPGESPH